MPVIINITRNEKVKINHEKNYTETVRNNLQKIEKYCREHFIPQLKMISWQQLNYRWSSDSHVLSSAPTVYIFTVDVNGQLRFRVNGITMSFGPEYDELDVYENLAPACELIVNWQEVKKHFKEELSNISENIKLMERFEA